MNVLAISRLAQVFAIPPHLGGGTLLLTMLAATSSAQVIDPSPPSHGQWAGPWDLRFEMIFQDGVYQLDGNGDPMPGTFITYSPPVIEIAHSTLLPPPSPAQAQSSLYAGKVIFINNRGTPAASNPPGPGTWEFKPQPTFVWNPNNPGVVTEYVVAPNTTYEDLFCSGHTYLGDGRPITSGGLNRPAGGMVVNPVGHGQSYVLTTDLQPNGVLEWAKRGGLAHERWYPTPTTLDDGSILTTGHTGNPPNGDRYRQILQLTDPLNDVWTWTGDLANRRANESNCSLSAIMSLNHYPRFHLLTTGELVWTDGREGTSQGGLPLRHVAYFLPVKFNALDQCLAFADTPWQWHQGLPAPTDTRGAAQKGGQSVHLIVRDPAQPEQPLEVLYYFGGTVQGQDDFSCPCIAGTPSDDAYNTKRVARMTTPSRTTPWDLGVAQMHYGRVNANAVILLDGSVLLVGGADRDFNQAQPPCEGNLAGLGCVHRTIPERFKPFEVFDGVPQQGDWNDMDEQSSKRQYHSVAGLLPDGRVYSAGGTYSVQNGPDDRFTIEIYSPPYLFTGARPEILTTFPTELTYQEQKIIEVKIRAGNPLKRMALVRPGTATHAFDQSQRYVELEQLQTTLKPGTTDVWQVTVVMPFDGFEAPPGWYMLTAVGPLNVPSPAKWVKLE